MENIKLVKPSLEYKESFCDALEGFEHDMRNGFWNVGGVPLTKEGVEKYIEDTAFFERGERLPEGRLPSHTYRLVEQQKKKVIGCINIRHALTPFLEKYGGHIGYAIVPSERQKGYGTLILQMALQKVLSDTGLQKVLLTCDEDNIASKKIIEKNGGVFENKIVVEGKDYSKLRYRIDCH